MWTVEDACAGTQIFGATGSGKTTGSGAALARSFLKPRSAFPGFGGLVLTAKGDELEDWRKLLIKAERIDDLEVFEPDVGHQFNFLEYERRQPHGGGLTQNLVSLFLTAMSSKGGSLVSNSDPFWDESLRELLTHTVDLAALGALPLPGDGEEEGSPLSLELLFQIVRSAPRTLDEARSASWRENSTCAKLLVEAERRRDELTAGRVGDLDQTQAYWLRDFPGLAERTRSIVVGSFTAKAAGLLRSPIRELFCEGSEIEQFAPDRCFEGKVIVLQLPVKQFAEVGRFAQVLYKTVWQRAVERRALTGDWRPVFLWVDEAQYFLTSADAFYQQTARSKFAATVYLTQNLPNYHAALNGASASESLLGNLRTKIFHANGDPLTNEWAERMFARTDKPRISSTVGGERVQSTSSSSMEPLVPAVTFTELACGGSVSNFCVDSILFQAGRLWRETGTTRLDFPFEQHL